MPASLQQSATPAPPAPPAPPGVATPSAEVVTTGQLAGAQMTRHDVDVLRARRTELSNQLESATGRRQQLVEQIQHSSGASRAGLEARLQVLDQRAHGGHARRRRHRLLGDPGLGAQPGEIQHFYANTSLNGR